ncbi:MAG: sodium:solute symporter [Cryomorphaceae bacterium]|nr:MAG: sodium:solute symporter [Cryomorphaceae bacterium]
MSSILILGIIGVYFLSLFAISQLTKGRSDSRTFFSGNRNSKWYIVAFGMVGASLSGITFISVPGDVGILNFTYFQVVLGYLVGYFIVTYLLLPIYYKKGLTSIYEFLGDRFGIYSHKTGAFFFFVSRVLGASFRLFLVAIVLQEFIFDQWGIPFEITVTFSILLIWIYTFQGGINTVIWTDTIQTFFMILSVLVSIFFITNSFGQTFFEFLDSKFYLEKSQVFIFDDFYNKNYFIKSFLGGMFITICMTGLDQDMMQKNLTCKNLNDAQKNMIVFSLVLVCVTFVFLILGSILFKYIEINDILIPNLNGRPNTDLLFPLVAFSGDFGIILPIIFLIGLIAAAYSSADSALTSLTTSFCVDFLNIEQYNQKKQNKIRVITHVSMSIVLLITIVIYKNLLSTSVIDSLLIIAGFTYGPLLGLFSFGIFTNHKIHDKFSVIVCILSVVFTTLIFYDPLSIFNKYQIGYELLPINGLITFLGLFLIRKTTT